jgi:hypothetical protein
MKKPSREIRYAIRIRVPAVEKPRGSRYGWWRDADHLGFNCVEHASQSTLFEQRGDAEVQLHRLLRVGGFYNARNVKLFRVALSLSPC